MAPFFGGIEPISELTYKMHVIPKSDDNCSALLPPAPGFSRSEYLSHIGRNE